MKPTRVEYHFLKRSIQQFSQDLHQIQNLITNKILSDDEALNLMSEIVAVKEVIESLEKIYLKQK